MVTFEDLFLRAELIGIMEFVIFLLIFIVIYAVLQKTKILGENKKNLNVAFAVIIGLLVVIPHVLGTYPVDRDPVEIIKKAIPQVSIVTVAIIFLLILLGVFGQEEVFLGMSAPGWVILLSLTAIVLIFGSAADWWSPSISQKITNFFGPDVLAIVVMILVFGIIIAYITSEPKEEKIPSKRFGIDLDKLFKK